MSVGGRVKEKDLVQADKFLKYVSQNLNICDNKFQTLFLICKQVFLF